jgi:UDP-glucose:(heptosyl)LPS alpha-1,3-glucosyltransferase
LRVALSFPQVHRRGGVERIVQECARFLAAREHAVDIYAAAWDPLDDPRIAFHRVPMLRSPSFLRGWSYHRQATQILAKASYDVLNTHGCVCPTGGVHWVQSLHAAWLDQARKFRRWGSAARLKQQLNPLHPILLRLEAKHFRQRQYQHIIATTPEVRQDLHDYYGVPLTDVSIIPNGYAPTEFSPEVRQQARETQRQKLGLADDQVALLFVANELDRKGYQTILQALKILNRPELRLLVVGRASAAIAKERASRMGLDHAVMVCGSTARVADYHAAADLFVLPTQYEAFCLAILEALGSGLPVITSDIPGARNAILPGVNGAIVRDPMDGAELANVLTPFLEPAYRHRIAQQTPATVGSYQWPVVLQQYERVLQRYAGKA